MEDPIASPRRTADILRRHPFPVLKKYGQNFLIDLHVVDKICRVAAIGPQDVCIEIGPGLGGLTQALAERAGRVVAVEIDRRLIPVLEENLAAYANVTLVQGDFMKIDLPAFLREQGIRGPVKVVANLPYYITTPILMTLLESLISLTSVTVMVQEEVARRIKAEPGSREYGALSLAVQYRAMPCIAAMVPPNCFIPRPTVGSAVVHLSILPPSARVKVEDENLMFALIKAAFGQRRKILANSIANSPELSFSKEQVQEALSALGFSDTVRGEALALTDFAALADRLRTYGAEANA